MKNLILSLTAIIAFSISTYAQVGIGSVPKSESILDLTNSNNKYLILPLATGAPTSILLDTASVIYYNDNIYMRTSNGYKVFTPWKWDGDSTHIISSPSTSTVGIGVIPISGAPFRLQVSNVASDVSSTGSSASVIVGDPNTKHFLIDNDEIMAKTNPTVAGVLKLQEDDGTVEIRTAAATTTNTVLTANGSIDASGNGSIKENGFDLVPSGTVVMWYGTVNASGYPMMGATANTNWHICDGNAGTPDLRERFVVGAGGDNPTVTGGAYSLSNNGGSNSVTLSIAEIPTHDHGGTTTGTGTHNHAYKDKSNNSEDFDHICALGCGMTAGGDAKTDADRTTSTDGSHSHTIPSQGSGNSHENRPPYYALIYIMKL